MRWLQAAAVAFSIVMLTGCPSEFGKEGRIAKAVRKDVQENLLELKSCSDAWKQEVCGNGPNRDWKKCQECGGK